MEPLLTTEEELEERLARPSAEDVAAVAALDGDILILGAGGKMGPSLAGLAIRAVCESGVSKRVIAVARFSNEKLAGQLAGQGIEVIRADLLEPGVLAALPDAFNVIFMAARKFGTSGSAEMTWAMNTYLPGLVAERYRASKIVAFSSGNVYPLLPAREGGATEQTAVAPVGEYAQSVLGRERMFQYGWSRWGTPVTLLRLNYAIDLRYGVLLDIARSVFDQRPVDLRMGFVNVIWQGDANSMCLRSLAHCAAPPLVLNITGPETLAVRWLALELGRRLGVEPVLTGEEAESALLSNASEAFRRFGKPRVTVDQMLDWISGWVMQGGATLGKPTHYQVRDGRF